MTQSIQQVAELHILDDFLFISPDYHKCQGALHTFQSICRDIGVPLAPEKTEGPAQSLAFAGIHLNTVEMYASLPMDKVQKFISYIDLALPKRSVTLREMQSLTGMLNFACQIMPPARAFSRRLHDLTIGVTRHYHHIKLSQEAKRDLVVWREFLLHYNYKTFFLDYNFLSSHVLKFYTDSAASIGFAGIFKNQWFMGHWDPHSKSHNIALLELYPIVLALNIWGPSLSNKCVLLISDNNAVVHIINSFTSKHKLIMILLRHLIKVCMTHNIYVRSKHLSGRLNIYADMLSRGQVRQALALDPNLDRTPVQVPPQWSLPNMLLQ